jgi:hypothetical protein
VDEPAYFELLKNVFTALDDTQISRKITEIWFYLNFAKINGNELNLATDENGMRLIEDARYDYDSRGNWRFNENGRYGAEEIKLLRVLTSNLPVVAARITNINGMLDDCLWAARTAANG